MGRTVHSYRQALEAEIERWKSFRKGLRNKDAEAFDVSKQKLLASVRH